MLNIMTMPAIDPAKVRSAKCHQFLFNCLVPPFSMFVCEFVICGFELILIRAVYFCVFHVCPTLASATVVRYMCGFHAAIIALGRGFEYSPCSLHLFLTLRWLYNYVVNAGAAAAYCDKRWVTNRRLLPVLCRTSVSAIAVFRYFGDDCT